jgi:N-acyl-D-aspartate/D-glutamate deacylase
MSGASYPTQLLADCLRGRRLLTMEQAVKALTDDPARLFGLSGRGRLEPGFFADIVLFDPETVGATAAALVGDLPGGAMRLSSDSIGVNRVLVNGVTTVIDGASTGALPGVALRSGRDTETVTCH